MFVPRVAFFTDCFHEVNGVALTSRQLDAFARRRGYPFFSVHAGPKTAISREGERVTVELRRTALSVPLDAGMAFDTLSMFQLPWIKRSLEEFRPDVIHITGPGDMGILGAALAWRLETPLVASWHTNLHEFGARRLQPFLPKPWTDAGERGMLDALLRFYKFGRVLLAPNPELVAMLQTRTGRPSFLMRRGIDAHLYSPERRTRTDDVFTIGYVGRLSPEKNVRLLVDIERQLHAAGFDRFRFAIVGQGGERDWLAANLKNASFPGVLKGEPLAEAYANMDVFAFPSETDTFGNVILEALASGLPTIVTSGGGPKFLIQENVTGFVANGAVEFAAAIRLLMRDTAKHAAMSRSAREHALGISWDAVFEKVYDAYRTSIITTDAPGTHG